VDADPGFFSTDLICTNKSGEQLADVDLSVTAYWLPNESKTVSVSSAGGTLQRFQLKGKARAAVKGDALLIQNGIGPGVEGTARARPLMGGG
jgi:hypothetical protein